MKSLDFARMLAFVALLVVVLLASAGGVWAQLPTDVDSTSLAFTFDRVVNDSGLGILGAVPLKIGVIDGHASAIFQSGDIVRGKYHVEGVLPVYSFGVKFFGDGGARGDSWSTLGKQIDFGTALQTPDIEINGIDANVGVGVFARNSGEFGRVSARNVLEEQGFDPNTLDDRGLENIKMPKRGITFPAGNSLQFLGYAGVDHPSGVSGKVKFVQQLTGKDKTQQLILGSFVSRDLGNFVSLEFGAEAGYQRYQNKWEQEYALLSALAVNF
ncbi:hypothetical protein F4212_01325 [Candidatus Poribacteria bacterium]|nr:hypothetical protein [Candidatus Poribacteria bacterium]